MQGGVPDVPLNASADVPGRPRFAGFRSPGLLGERVRLRIWA